jgi:prophage regulatory protein
LAADTPAVRLTPADPAPADPSEVPHNTAEARGRKARAAAAITAPVEPLLLAAAEAARLCGISEATWYRMASGGRTPAPVRLSRGCVRWRLDELREWIAAGCPERREWEARCAARNVR